MGLKKIKYAITKLFNGFSRNFPCWAACYAETARGCVLSFFSEWISTKWHWTQQTHQECNNKTVWIHRGAYTSIEISFAVVFSFYNRHELKLIITSMRKFFCLLKHRVFVSTFSFVSLFSSETAKEQLIVKRRIWNWIQKSKRQIKLKNSLCASFFWSFHHLCSYAEKIVFSGNKKKFMFKDWISTNSTWFFRVNYLNESTHIFFFLLWNGISIHVWIIFMLFNWITGDVFVYLYYILYTWFCETP